MEGVPATMTRTKPITDSAVPATSAGAKADRAASDADAQETMRLVGAQIRRMRKRRNMTLQQLGTETGMSVSMLSMLERGVATASISTLVAVSSALGTHMSELFGASSESSSPVRRLDDQTEVVTSSGVVRRLVHNDPSRGLEMVINEYAPGTSSGTEPGFHQGSEFGIVLAGTLTVRVNDDIHVLRAGDAIHYSSMTPHLLTNTGRSKARAVWVNLDN
jgi:transcriptional regulator with XRE-family HTH domain